MSTVSLLSSSYHCSAYLSAQTHLCSAPRATRSSSVVTLSRLPTSSSLRITNRSFRYASPHLWNQLPISFRQPYTQNTLLMMSHSLIHFPPSHLSPPSHIHCFIPSSKLTFSANLFRHSLLAPTWTAFSDYTGPDLLLNGFSFLVIFFILGRALD